MHPRQVLRELEKAMPEDAMVSTDIGNICQIANSYLRFNRPRSMFGAMMFGNCGYAFPTMIGCKVGAPDRTAIAYVGDGAWGMSFGEILTCVREKIPVTAWCSTTSSGARRRRTTSTSTRTASSA
jgi:sulfoacetaldehyde acetyltransferase